MAAALGGVKNYTLKTYLTFAEKLQEKAEELRKLGPEMESFTVSDVERALWSTAAASMPKRTFKSTKTKAAGAAKGVKRKRGI